MHRAAKLPPSRTGTRPMAARSRRQTLRGKSCDLVHILDPKINDTLKLMVQINSNNEGWIMSAIFDFLYREYCRARLVEMRKQLLISPERHEVPEVICDAQDAVGATVDRSTEDPADRQSGPRVHWR